MVEKELSDGHIDYVNNLNHIAKFYEETDQYENAGKTLEKALDASRRKYDNRDQDYAVELEKIAALQIKIGQYEKAEEKLAETLDHGVVVTMFPDDASKYMEVIRFLFPV